MSYPPLRLAIKLARRYLGPLRRKPHVRRIEARLRGRRCATLGDTSQGFFRPGWETVDLQQGADHVCDFRHTPLPFADASLDAVHSSHMVEHISLEQTRRLLREIHRCLRPGGYLRLSTPDLDLLIDRYRANDWRWFLEADGRYVLDNVIAGGFPPELLLMHNRLVGWLASYSGRLDTGGGPVIEKAVVEEKLASLGKHGFRDWCVSQLQPGRVLAHIHVFDFAELAGEVKVAGFREVWRSSYGESRSPDMSRPAIDRERHRRYSLYVEAMR